MTHVYHRYNAKGRDYIVGDIHGCFEKLAEHLRGFFDITKDRLFAVADLGDRGPDSRISLWWLAQPWFFSTRGNHDQGLIDYHRCTAAGMDHMLHLGRKFSPERVVANGGRWFVEMEHEERAVYAGAFEALPLAITLETMIGPIGLVHGEVPIDCGSWKEFLGRLDAGVFENPAMISALLGRKRIETGHTGQVAGVRAVVTGHTTLAVPAQLGNHILIDTGACYEDRDFTILNAATLQPVLLQPAPLTHRRLP